MEVSVVRLAHPGHGEGVNIFWIIVFPVRQAPQKAERERQRERQRETERERERQRER